ncbi:MAG: ABC transporter substrate-binding protein [Chloroflexi bacterium]|nr:ABC transporter substrate-binding protein [Chloroflexota bacterium]
MVREAYWHKVLRAQISRRRVIGTAAGLVGVSLVGCAAAPAATPTPARAPAPGATATPAPRITPTPTVKVLDQLVLAFPRDVPTLDGNVQPTHVEGANLNDLIYDPLTTRDRDLKLAPGLATSWKSSSDGKVWEVKLRTGVKFHNGEEFDAEAVKFSIERIQKPELKSNQFIFWKDVGVEVLAKDTVRIIYKEPSPLLPNRLGVVNAVPRRYILENGDKVMNEKPMGTGPYKFVKWAKDDSIEMEWAGVSHWRVANPPAKKIIFKVIPTESARIAALKTGAADIIWNIAPDLTKEVTADPNLGITVQPASSVLYISISLFKEGPLRDKRVRQALGYALDLKTIVKELFGDLYQVMKVVSNPLCFGYDAAIESYPYDPKKAKQLLAEAGYPNGFEVVFTTPAVAYPKYKEYTQALANYWAEIGVKATIKPDTDSASVWARGLRMENRGPEGIYHTGQSCGSFFDLDEVLGAYFINWNQKDATGNHLYIEDGELDKIIMATKTTVDPEARRKLFNQALRRINEEAYAIPLWALTYNTGYNKKKIKTFRPHGFLLSPWDIEVA